MPLTADDIALWQSVMTNSGDSLPVMQAKSSRACVQPPQTVDLHGLTLQEAHSTVIAQIEHWHGKIKSVNFITGKSGDIRREFSHWVSGLSCVRLVEPMNGGGCFRVYYKKNKSLLR